MEKKVLILDNVQNAALTNLINLAVKQLGLESIGLLIDVLRPVLNGASNAEVIAHAATLSNVTPSNDITTASN
jgi:hypothetical protein